MANTPVILSPTAAAEIAAGLRELRAPKRQQRRRSWPWVLFPPDWPGIVISNNPLVLPAGKAPGAIFFPSAGTITRVTCLSDDQAGPDTYGIDIRKVAYSGYPGTPASIVASAPPHFIASQKYQDATLTGWTTAINAGDCLGFWITGTPSVATWCVIWLEVA
jgi:hypothetical protein